MRTLTEVTLICCCGLMAVGCSGKAVNDGAGSGRAEDGVVNRDASNSNRAAHDKSNNGNIENERIDSDRSMMVRVELVNSIGLKLMLIRNGTFTMGTPPDEADRWGDETQHQVTISQDYYLGVYEVTQTQYERVMGSHPSKFRGVTFSTGSYPVEQVSWEDAVEFCKRLSDLPEEQEAGRVYRLPTEAEWEYACRAGSKTAYSFGDDVEALADYAWYVENSAGHHPVGEKQPNAWGLHDMHGNVWEWCSDWYSDYPKHAVADPSGPGEGSLRVYRGGCYSSVAAFCLSSSRFCSTPTYRSHFYGFRVALSSAGIPK